MKATQKEIIGFFRAAARRLYLIVQNADTTRPFTVYRREQLGAIARTLEKLDSQSRTWADEYIPGVMKQAATEIVAKIDAQDEPDFSFKFSGVPTEAVKVLTEKAYLDFANSIVGLKRSGERAVLDKRLIQSKIVQGVIQGSSFARTQQDLLKHLREKDFAAMVDKRGVNWSPERYTNMLVRTQTMYAQNVAAKEQMLAAGRLYAIIPTIRPDIDGEDVCNEWERKKYINLEEDPLPPYHPNCRHSPQPVSFEQLKAERPDLYAKAIEYYEKVSG